MPHISKTRSRAIIKSTISLEFRPPRLALWLLLFQSGPLWAGCGLLRDASQVSTSIRVYPAPPSTAALIFGGAIMLALGVVVALLLARRLEKVEQVPGLPAKIRRRSRDMATLFFLVLVLGISFSVWRYDVPEDPMRVSLVCLESAVAISYPTGGQAYVRLADQQQAVFTKGKSASRALRIFPHAESMVLPLNREVILDIYSQVPNHLAIFEMAGLQRPKLPVREQSIKILFTNQSERLVVCNSPCKADSARLAFVPQPEAQFEKWQRARIDSFSRLDDRNLDELMNSGKRIYSRRCAPCHGSAGDGNPVFPALNSYRVGNGSLAEIMKVVSYGARKGSMKAFRDQLTVIELAAVLTYIRNAWDYSRGDLIQPSTVAAYLASTSP